MIDDPTDRLDGKARAVSPVIGVILMVAITVVLAAVTGAFVVDLGDEVDGTGPTARLSVEDADETIDSNRSQFVVVEHAGGDDIDASDLKITVRYESNNTLVGTWDDGSWDAKGQDNFDIDGASGYDNGIDYNGGTLSTDDTLTTGDALTWYLDDDPGSSTSPGIEADVKYEIAFVDTGTNNVISEVVVRVE